MFENNGHIYVYRKCLNIVDDGQRTTDNDNDGRRSIGIL